MKKVLLYTVCAFFAFAAKAQSAKDEVSILQASFGMAKKEIVTAHMKLTDAEATKFWPVYDEYEAARKIYGQNRVTIITAYAQNLKGLTDAKATELVNALFENRMGLIKLQQKTFDKMSKALNAVRAAQFTQIEGYLETTVRAAIGDQTPLIGETDPKKQ